MHSGSHAGSSCPSLPVPAVYSAEGVHRPTPVRPCLPARPQLRVWNRGDYRCKLVTLCLTKRAAGAEGSPQDASGSSSGGGTGSFVSVAASSEEEEEDSR